MMRHFLDFERPIAELEGKIEEAIATGDRTRAQAALNDGEPIIMRAAQRGIIHKNAASRKVSRLAHRVAKLGQ